MMPELVGRWQTRLALFMLVALSLAGMQTVGAAPGGAPLLSLLFLLYWLPVGLVLDILYDALQRLRREGNWPLLFLVGALAFECLITFGAAQILHLPGLPACLKEQQDLAMRRVTCVLPGMGAGDALALLTIVAVVTLFATTVVLPVLRPKWRFSGWRLWAARGGDR